jgi:hypothetical protein
MDGECRDVIASNQLGRALFDGHEHSDDLARLLFLDEDSPSFHREWNRVADSVVAGMRAAVGHATGNSELTAFVGELTVRSEEFGKRWARPKCGRRPPTSFSSAIPSSVISTSFTRSCAPTAPPTCC